MWMSTCPRYLQHTSERPDCGGGRYQPGGCHSAVCCYSAEEHQGHSGVSLKSLLHVTEPSKALVKRFSFKTHCLIYPISFSQKNSQTSH